jgi:hypothetical protein
MIITLNSLSPRKQRRVKRLIKEKQRIELQLQLAEAQILNNKLIIQNKTILIVRYVRSKTKSKKIALMKMLNELIFDDIIMAIKTVLAQLNLFRTALHFTDAYINKNILIQTTYYKTLTSRP